MTCREFEHCAGALTLRELSQVQNHQLRDHTAECQKCAAWFQQQRTLATTMQTLQARTAACAADPNIEQALLRAFRQRGVQAEMAHATPIAIRLSRFFEVGAYVAVAAALVVAVFLGVRLMQQRSNDVPVKGQAAQPTVTVPSLVADSSGSQPHSQVHTMSQSNVGRTTARVLPTSESGADTMEASQTGPDADYVALMFCDPLSCSSDAQVVRMELPAPGTAASGGEQDAQIRVADVVVGYDGVVRAVRIVN